MIYKTKDGIAFHVLPDNARCACEGVHPDVLSECPLHNFDDDGDLCVPELCDYYDEVTE